MVSPDLTSMRGLPDGYAWAVTMTDLAALGVTPAEVLARLAASLGLTEVDETVTPDSLLDRFDPAALPRDPWVVD